MITKIKGTDRGGADLCLLESMSQLGFTQEQVLG